MIGEFEPLFERLADMERKGRLFYWLETGEEFTTEELAKLARLSKRVTSQKLQHLKLYGRVDQVRLVEKQTDYGVRKMAVWRIRRATD